MANILNTQLRNIGFNFAKILGTSITKEMLEETIEENPFYPTLLSLSDTFNKFKIKNKAFHLNEVELLEMMPNTPFVAYIHIKDEMTKDFVLVTSFNSKEVTYLYKKNKNIKVVTSDFFKTYENIVLFAETNENSGDEKFSQNRSSKIKRNIVKVTSFVLIIITFCIIAHPHFSSILHIPYINQLAIKTIGLFATILILIHDIDNTNSFVKSICSRGIKTNCSAILSSKGGKVLGISWGEIGFVYFSCTILILVGYNLVLPNDIFTALTVSFWLNVFASFFIIYSIYFQWKIAKQWCILCLIVQIALFLELITNLFLLRPIVYSYNIINVNLLLIVIISFSFPFSIWVNLKPILLKSLNYKTFKTAYKRLQHNPDIFNALLMNQPRIHNGWEDLGISIGNSKAKNTIVKICNPYCTPCEHSQSVIMKILSDREDINLRMIYVSENWETKSSRIIKHLLSIYSNNDDDKTYQAINDWYLNVGKEYKNFINKYPLNENLSNYDFEIDRMSTWCQNASISHTPTIYINGHEIPPNFNIEELVHVI